MLRHGRNGTVSKTTALGWEVLMRNCLSTASMLLPILSANLPSSELRYMYTDFNEFKSHIQWLRAVAFSEQQC